MPMWWWVTHHVTSIPVWLMAAGNWRVVLVPRNRDAPAGAVRLGCQHMTPAEQGGPTDWGREANDLWSKSAHPATGRCEKGQMP